MVSVTMLPSNRESLRLSSANGPRTRTSLGQSSSTLPVAHYFVLKPCPNGTLVCWLMALYRTDDDDVMQIGVPLRLLLIGITRLE